MAKLNLAETTEEATRRDAKQTLATAVRTANAAVNELIRQVADRGGRTAWLAELGPDQAAIVDVALACKTFVEATSDLPAIELPEV